MSADADVIDIQPARHQRVLILSWEYPPVLVGGLGRHVHALSVALAAAGHEVTVVTRHAEGAPLEEYAEGVRILRAAEDPVRFPLATDSLLAWTMAFNHTLTRTALRAAESGAYDVVHAHDWLVAHTAVTLAEHLDLPLVTTIHATEAGRHQGWLPAEMNRTIHGVEHWLSNASARVIACSGYMRDQVARLFDVPAGRIDVVPNGVDDRAWHARPRAVSAARARFAGDGPYRDELVDQARRLRLADTVRFAGFLDATQLPAVLAATDATVVPSLYEPFGMIALEAAAAGAPLAVADTGGLAEIVEPGVTGVTFPRGDPDALAGAVDRLLGDEVFARRVARRARTMVAERYTWSAIAARTAGSYATARREHGAFQARRAAALLAGDRSAVAIPDGNLLAGAAS
ncbi:glycosyltransferase family 4 protein [Micromonospora chersina]